MGLTDIIRFSRLTHELGKVPARHPSWVRRVQLQRFRQLVQHAAKHSPFYREKYSGIDLDKVKPHELPPTTKEEIRTRFDDVVTDPRVRLHEVERFAADDRNLGRWFLGEYAVCHTSGSQGAPLWIVQDRSCVELMFALSGARASASRQPGIIEGLRRLWNPLRVAIVAFRRGFYPSGAMFEFMQEIVGPYVRVQRFSSMQPDLVDRLREFQPHVISSFASVLEALAEERDRLGLTSLRQITNSSEQLVPRARRRIESAFGVRVSDHYGTGECLLMADACDGADGGVHINADWSIVEVVDDDYNPVPLDASGSRILVTNLANRVQPFIRYEIGDRLSIASAPCSCGSRLPRIGAFDGRRGDLFWINEGGTRRFLNGVLFHAAVDAVGCVREWQARQLPDNQVELRLEFRSDGDENINAARRAVVDKLRELGLPDCVSVSTIVVERLAADPRTGKVRRMIALSENSVELETQHA